MAGYCARRSRHFVCIDQNIIYPRLAPGLPSNCAHWFPPKWAALFSDWFLHSALISGSLLLVLVGILPEFYIVSDISLRITKSCKWIMQIGFIEAHTKSEIIFPLQSTNTLYKWGYKSLFINFIFHGLETFLWSDIDYKGVVTPLTLTVQLIQLHKI